MELELMLSVVEDGRTCLTVLGPEEAVVMIFATIAGELTAEEIDEGGLDVSPGS